MPASLSNKKKCIQCKKEYEPKHYTKEEAFRTNDLESREQWITGICSTKCWKDMLGPDGLDIQ